MVETGEGGTILTKQSSGPGALTLDTESAARRPEIRDVQLNSNKTELEQSWTGLEQALWSFPDVTVTPVN